MTAPGGYVPPQAGGVFEHTSMVECPTHGGNAEGTVHFRRYESPSKRTSEPNPWGCCKCAAEPVSGVVEMTGESWWRE